MFEVNGNPILAEPITILRTLKEQLAAAGIELLKDIKPGPSDIQITCPNHANGQEHKPSCGITTTQKGSLPAGAVHCFTCGYSVSLAEMVSNCFGYDDYGTYGIQWLVKNFLTVSIEDRKNIDLDFSRGNIVEKIDYITEEELDSYRYLHDYMYKRKLTDGIIEKFDVGYDKAFQISPLGVVPIKRIPCLTFPVRDITGGTLFVARRAVKFKLFHYPENARKPVYGIFELPEVCSELIVCESIINALTCWTYGRPAVALLGLGTSYQYQQLIRLPVRKLIAAFDGDSAGENATKKLVEQMQGKKLVTHFKMPMGKDINDLSFEEFNALPELF